MNVKTKARNALRVQILDAENSEPQTVTVVGRDAWALEKLISAGTAGCTPITTPGPRWSHYTWKLRQAGIAIETIHESHGGPFPGHHAKYILRSKVAIVDQSSGRA